MKALKSEENKQDIKWIEGIISKDIRTNEIKYEIDEIKNRKIKVKRKSFKNKVKKHIWFSAIWNNKIFWWKYLYS